LANIGWTAKSSAEPTNNVAENSSGSARLPDAGDGDAGDVDAGDGDGGGVVTGLVTGLAALALLGAGVLKQHAMTPPAVIFDVDGTLVDTNYLHTLAWARGFRDAGETVSMSAIHRLIGMGPDQLVEELLDHESDEASDGHSAQFEKLMPEIKPFPGAAELLEKVHERGAKVVLASSASENELDAMIEAIEPADGSIDHIVKKDDVEESKPAPDIFEAAISGAGLDPKASLVVGDTVWDIEAAKKCDLQMVAVLTGGISRQELEEAGAIAVYEDVAQLLRELDDSPIGALLSEHGGDEG